MSQAAFLFVPPAFAKVPRPTFPAVSPLDQIKEPECAGCEREADIDWVR
jgi:hypothetical protein